MTKRLRAPAAFKVLALFPSTMKNMIKSILIASRQMKEFDAVFKKWKKEMRNGNRNNSKIQKQ